MLRILRISLVCGAEGAISFPVPVLAIKTGGVCSQALTVFRLDAIALSVIATATWLAGWLSHSGIVSKRLNLSENFFDHLKAPSF